MGIFLPQYGPSGVATHIIVIMDSCVVKATRLNSSLFVFSLLLFLAF